MLKVYDNTQPQGGKPQTQHMDPLPELSADHNPAMTPSDAPLPRDQVIIEDLILDAFIGVFDHEYTAKQALRFDITVDVAPLTSADDHDVNNIVRYDHIIADIQALLARGHVDLVETLAEDIAALCLAYVRAEQVTVTVAKLEAFEEAGAVGVRITRRA